MKKIIYQFIYLFVLPIITFAQSDIILWEKSYGGSKDDIIYSINQTMDDGYIIGCYSMSKDGDVTDHHGSEFYSDGWVVKLNNTGGIQWKKSLGGTLDDNVNSIKQTLDSGYIVALNTESNNGDVDTNYGVRDSWIVKLDSAGTIQWTKVLGGSSYDEFPVITTTSDGGYIMAIASSSSDGFVKGNKGSYDFWVVRLNNAGDTLWTKSLGGTNSDKPASILQTADGGFILTGDTWSSDLDVTTNKGLSDCWVVKLDTSGNISWQKSFGGSNYDYSSSISQTKDGGYLIGGLTNSNNGDVTKNLGFYDYWLVKTDNNGVLQWQKSLGGSKSDIENSAMQTEDGGYFVAGYTSSNDSNVSTNYGLIDYWAVKLDSSGKILWEESLGGTNEDRAYTAIEVPNGGYVIGGYTLSNNIHVSTNKGEADCWLVKLACAPKPKPDICIVTVDSATGYNLVVWEKPANSAIESYNIYKETTTSNVYNVIGNVAYNNLSIFSDTNSSPKVKAARYKISSIDSCGFESSLSDSHKTMHLTVNLSPDSSVNLIWDHYEGFSFGTYRIWRGTSAINMMTLDSIQSNLVSYTDSTPPQSDSLYYQIEVMHPAGCEATLKSKNYKSAKSNPSVIKAPNNTIDTTGIKLMRNIIQNFEIFPNPYMTQTQIKYELVTNTYVSLNIYNILGEKIKTLVDEQQNAGQYSYAFSGNQFRHSSNIYILEWIVDGTIIVKKLIEYK